jgi:hypothetical protein
VSTNSSSLARANNFVDDEGFGFMGNEPQMLLTVAKAVVVNHAPLVRARIVLRYPQQSESTLFTLGDIVSVAVPQDQRLSGDFSCFSCRVLSHPHSSYYELRSESCTIRQLFPGGELGLFPPKMPTSTSPAFHLMDHGALSPTRQLPDKHELVHCLLLSVSAGEGALLVNAAE